MGIDPLEAMDRVRQRLGKPAINPFAIDGVATEPDPLTIEEQAEQDLIARMGDDEPPMAPEPVRMTPRPTPQPQPTAAQLPGPAPDFLVVIQGKDAGAAFKGREVQLSDRDTAKVKTVVLEAFAREARELLRQTRTPRRRKTASTTSGAAQVVAAPKKMGRPKGSKNKPKEISA